MYSGFNPNATRDVVCPFDKSEVKTVFTLSESLSYKVRAEVKDKYADYFYDIEGNKVQQAVKYLYSARNIAIVKHGLKGIKDFKLKDGSDLILRFSNDKTLVDDCLQALDVRFTKSEDCGYESLIDWLASEIWDANVTSEKEVKN